MDTEVMRLLTEHAEEHESTVSMVVEQIAQALAAQPPPNMEAFIADIRARADSQPDLRACLHKLLDDLYFARQNRLEGRRPGELTM